MPVIPPAFLNGDVHMGALDVTVFILYVVTLLAIGGFVSYKHRKSEDLFLAGRSMKWGNVGLSIFGTNIGPTFLIATCGAGYTSGWSPRTSNGWLGYSFSS